MVIAALAPIALSAILGSRSAKIARKQSRRDAENKFVDLRNAAHKGGFNPLTALQATGGQGYGGYASSAPPLMSAELLRSSAQSLEDRFNGREALERRNLEVATDLAEIQRDKARLSATMSAPSVAPSAPRLGVRPTPVGAVADAPEQFPVDRFGNPVTTGVETGFGTAIVTAKGVSDAEAFETRWADVGGNIAGLGIMAMDLGATLGPHIARGPLGQRIRQFAVNSVTPSLRPASSRSYQPYEVWKAQQNYPNIYRRP